MHKMRIMITIALVSLLAMAASCTITPNDGTGDDAAGFIQGDESNPFANPGVEPDDDGGDVGVDVESDSEAQVETEDEYTSPEEETEGQEPLEITTEIDEEYTEAIIGDEEPYEAGFRVLDQGGYYEWTIEGVPAGSGLVFEEIGSRATRAWLHGHPTQDALGTHHITVTVRDADDATNSDSIEYDLTVVHKSLDIDIDFIENPCEEPLRIVVEKMGDYTDHDLLQKGEARFLIGDDVLLKLKAVRGDKPAFGEVSWEWTSQVEDSEHCLYYQSSGSASAYDYDWYYDDGSPPQPGCELRSTTNPTWEPGRRQEDNALVLTGRMLFDGPLKVRNKPLDEHAVERLMVKATDQCKSQATERPNNIGKLKPAEGTKMFRFEVKYPGDGDHGGDMNDIDMDMTFKDVAHFWDGGNFDTECDNGDYSYICEMNAYLVILFTGSSGLSDQAQNDFENGYGPISAIEESLGYIVYEIDKAVGGDPQSVQKSVKKVQGVAGDIAGAKRIYLLWSSPKYKEQVKWDGNVDPVTRRLDFDILSFVFKNRYWWADYSDYQENVFNNNIVQDFVEIFTLTGLGGMSPKNADGGIFRRRELAAWIVHWTPPE